MQCIDKLWASVNEAIMSVKFVFCVLAEWMECWRNV